jgi:hypothetical protein
MDTDKVEAITVFIRGNMDHGRLGEAVLPG